MTRENFLVNFLPFAHKGPTFTLCFDTTFGFLSLTVNLKRRDNVTLIWSLPSALSSNASQATRRMCGFSCEALFFSNPHHRDETASSTKKRGYFPQKLFLNLETEQMKAEKKRSNIRSDVQFPSRKRPFYFSQTVVETEVDEKWAITEGFDSGSVITLQISDFPSFICRLFIAAAFLHENKMISLRQHNARNNRLGQTFAEAWWAWLTITEFHCGFSLLFFLFPPRPFIHPLFWKAVFFFF